MTFDPGIIKYDNNPVVTTAGKNKQAVSRRRHLAWVLSTLMCRYALRHERIVLKHARVAFLPSAEATEIL